MKLKKGFVLRKVADNYVVVATGEASKNFHGMVKCNGVSADIWKGLIDGCEEEEIVSRLTDKYEVSPEKAAEDTRRVLREIEEAGFFSK